MAATRKGGAVVFDDGSEAQATVPVSGTDGTILAGSGTAPKGSKTFSASAPTGAAAVALAANASRIEALIRNAGSVVVYLGKDNTVTTANGVPLNPGDALTDDRSTDAWWAITAGGTGDLRISEVA